VDIEQLDALTTSHGQALLNAIAACPSTDRLKLHEQYRASHDPALVAAACLQIELREKAQHKFTRSERMWLTRSGLEQASGEAVAVHRAARVAASANRVADLCCGIGGDSLALAAAGIDSLLVADRDPLHVKMARLNCAVYQAAGEVEGRVTEVEDVDLAGVDTVFVDPARRGAHGRLTAGLSSPSLE